MSTENLRRDWLLEAAAEQLEPCSAAFRTYVLGLIEADIATGEPPSRREELIDRLNDAVEDSKAYPCASSPGLVGVGLVAKKGAAG